MSPDKEAELDAEIQEQLYSAWENFRDLMGDAAHKFHGIQRSIQEVHVDGPDLVVIMDDESIHHYRIRLEKL